MNAILKAALTAAAKKAVEQTLGPALLKLIEARKPVSPSDKPVRLVRVK